MNMDKSGMSREQYFDKPKPEEVREQPVYKAIEKYLDDCVMDDMSQTMSKSDQEYHMKVNVYMIKRVVQIMLSEMAKVPSK